MLLAPLAHIVLRTNKGKRPCKAAAAVVEQKVMEQPLRVDNRAWVPTASGRRPYPLTV